MEWNIQKGFPLPDVSVDAIDMTVSMHHITQYKSDIDTLFRQASNIIKDGGILHIGEGNVDMKYSERKIQQIARDICAFGVRGVLISDGRYADSSPRQWHVGERDTEATIHVSASGMVGIDMLLVNAVIYLSNPGTKM